MSQRIKLKFFPSDNMISDMVCDLALQGFNIKIEPCLETDHYVLIAELVYEGEDPELFPAGPTIH